MTTEIAKKETFEEKMKARIVDSIGDLMPDEELQKIISRSIDEAFFKKQTRQEGYHIIEKDPWVYDIVRSLLTEQVKEQVKYHIDSNRVEFGKIITEVIQKGISDAFVNTIKNTFQQQMFDFEMNIKNKMGLVS